MKSCSMNGEGRPSVCEKQHPQLSPVSEVRSYKEGFRVSEATSKTIKVILVKSIMTATVVGGS
jgi:hypothetical protein